MTAARTDLPRTAVNGYAAGTITGGIYATLPGLLLLPYLTDVVGIDTALAGTLVLLPGALIVAATPVVGRMTDRSTDPARARQRWVLCSGLALAVLLSGTFLTPFPVGSAAQAAFVVALLVAGGLAYASYQGPYMAVAAEIVDREDQRTRLMARRVLVLAVTILLVGAAAPAIIKEIGGADGYRAVGLGSGLLMLVGVIWCVRRTPSALHPPPPAGPPSGTAWTAWTALRLPALRRLLINYALQGVATGSSLAGLIFVATYILHDVAEAGVVFVCLSVAAGLATPLWERVGARYGKIPGLVAGTLFCTAGNVGLLCVGRLPHPAVYALGAVVGVGYAAMQVFPMALLPDVTTAAATVTGTPAPAGLFAGLWTSVETASVATGTQVFAAVLAFGGYSAAVAGHPVAQSDDALTAMVVGFAALPALLMAASLVPLIRYRLPEPAVPLNPPV